jgi:hypothetical protein
MPDIDQSLLDNQAQLNAARLADQNRDAKAEERTEEKPLTSIADVGEKKPAPGEELGDAMGRMPVGGFGMAADMPGEMRITDGGEQEEKSEEEMQVELQNQQNQATQQAEASSLQTKAQQAQRVQQMAQKAKAAQGTARAINVGTGITVIGLIITFILMNLQLFLGNLFGVGWMPKLETWEMVIIGIIDFLLFLIVVIIVGFIGAIFNCASGILEGFRCAAEVVKSAAGG